MASIDAGEINLGKLFTADYDFTIPDYQRPYSWGVEEAIQLLDDLKTSLQERDEEPYFLGSLVLVKDKAHPSSEVIDGQQRLTTLTILLACLRDLTDDANLRADIHKLIEEPEVIWDNRPAAPRVALRPRDAKFFREYVQTDRAIGELIQLDDATLANDAQKAIRDNARALFAALDEWDASTRKDLFVMIAGRTFLVVVSTPDLSSAYRIFSVMNSRGLPLTPPDIFKSQIIGAIPEAQRSRYATRWEDLEEMLGRDEFGALFLHLRTVIAKTRAVRGLLIEFPQQVLGSYLPDRATAFVDELLEPYAQAHHKLLNLGFGPGQSWQPVNTWIGWLSQLDNDDWRPAALWALTRHANEPEFLAEFFCRLERLAASMLIRRYYTTPRVTRYLELLTQLDNGDGLGAAALQLTDEEKADTRRRIDGDVYLAAQVRRYLLLRLDALLANNPGVTYQHRIITVEHVLPQTPARDSQWVRDFTEEERADWTHRLGNLLLLNRRKNSEAQNFDFEVKKAKYFTGSKGTAVFALTTQVLQEQQWTPDVLQARQRALTAKLFTEWQLSG